MEAQEIINQIGALSYVGIWLAAFFGKLLVIVPEEVIMVILGYIAGKPSIDLYFLIPLAIFGTLTSDILIYIVARKGSNMAHWIYHKIFPSHFINKREWIKENIKKVIFFSRFLMQLRLLGPFLAGEMKIPFKRFLYIDFLACVIYVPLYVILGYYFRGRIEAIFSGIGVVRNMLVTIFVLFVLWLILRHLRKILLKDKNNDDHE